MSETTPSPDQLPDATPGGPVPPQSSAGQPPTPPTGGNGLAITAMVLGIAAVVLCWFPLLGFPLGVAALVCGIIALRKRRAFGFSLTGVITGAVGILLSIVIGVVSVLIFVGAANRASVASRSWESVQSSLNAQAESRSAEAESRSAEAEQVHKFELKATVNKGRARIAYSTSGSSSSREIKNTTWTKTVEGKGSYAYSTLSMGGDYTTHGQKLTCEIKVDGVVVDHQEGSRYVSCRAMGNSDPLDD